MTLNEWKSQKSGTKALRIKTYNDAGQCVGIEYILDDDENFENEYEQATEVAPGFVTESCKVIRK